MIGAFAATAGKGREPLDAIGDATESRPDSRRNAVRTELGPARFVWALSEKGSAFRPGAAPGLPGAADEAARRVHSVPLRLVGGAQDQPGIGVGRVDRHGLFARLDGRGQ